MPFDYKKEYKEFYMPQKKPSIVEVPATIEAMHECAEQNGYEVDITDTRYHHEIYLSDPRKCDPSKLKTVVRHPIRKV